MAKGFEARRESQLSLSPNQGWEGSGRGTKQSTEMAPRENSNSVHLAALFHLNASDIPSPGKNLPH